MTIFEDHLVRDINAGDICQASFSLLLASLAGCMHSCKTLCTVNAPAYLVSLPCAMQLQRLQAESSLIIQTTEWVWVCCAGRYSKNTSLVLVTHGLAARIFLMRWFHWTVEQFMEVFNPPNAEVCSLLAYIMSLASARCDDVCFVVT